MGDRGATARPWLRWPWRACCANGANWPPGCATRPRTSKTPTRWNAPPPTGKPAGATNPGCWKAPGLAEAETLAAKPGFRDRLDPTRDYLQASRRREDDRIEADKHRREAELQAAKEHAAALRKRSRILITVLAVTAVVAVEAGILGVRASNAQHQADARFREATSLRLVSEAQPVLAGARSGGRSARIPTTGCGATTCANAG